MRFSILFVMESCLFYYATPMRGAKVAFLTFSETERLITVYESPPEYIVLSWSHILLRIHFDNLVYTHLRLGLEGLPMMFSLHIYKESAQIWDPG
jgi:hypothetical protein